jgi:small subunit ribosomal protein S21
VNKFLMSGVTHVAVKARKGEDLESLIKRFKKKVSKAGITKEVRDKMYYEKPSDKRRRKKAQSIRNIKREEAKALEREERYKNIAKKKKRKGFKKNERFKHSSRRRQDSSSSSDSTEN